MADVRVINPVAGRTNKLRVAAYCRVSSDSEDQLHSYAAQIRFYTDLIRKTDGWELVDIYADEGLTGTCLDKRDEFHRMMRDCRKGKIGKILVKSVSRFARNTKDCLAELRELKLLGVSVRFEKENIDTETLTTELMVSVSGSLAQEESISISQNQRWSYQKRMKNGEFITCKAPFGYRLVDGKHLEIVEDEAKIVRWMFDSYLSGMSMYEIADKLTEIGVPTTDGKPYWQYTSVRYLLGNEKYMGDSLLQKTCVTNEFPFKKVDNKGQKAQYYVENSHPAIITRETFERARELTKRRRPYEYDGYMEYPLTRKIVCGSCGSTFKRRESKSGYVCWVCMKHDRSKESCDVGRIAETEIHDAFLRVYHKLKRHASVILHPVLAQMTALSDSLQRQNSRMLEINQAIAQTTEQNLVLSRLRSKGLIDSETYFEKCNAVSAKLAELKHQRRMLMESEDDEDIVEDIKGLIRIVENGPEMLAAFDEVLFADMVDKVIADSQEQIRFRLTGGIEFTERIHGGRR
jgi:DNA invertase Pin-like site-specific DNA recombinase